MTLVSALQRSVRALTVTAFLGIGVGIAMAQSEPTLNEVYATAQAGKLDQAQLMIQQVLVSHPNSAKAFFVQAELSARQGDLNRARESLAKAERFAPGLPFAKPAAVQALRNQLTAKATSVARDALPAATPPTIAAKQPSEPSSWVWPLLLAGGFITMAYFLFRKKAPAAGPAYPQSGLSPGQTGLGGPQTFGMGGTGAMQQPYGQNYGQPAAGSGMGGRIMGGVATGLAVGAGVMAAQAIGRNLMGGNEHADTAAGNHNNQDFTPIQTNPDMGGQDFGISDGGSWDSGGGADAGGGDWD